MLTKPRTVYGCQSVAFMLARILRHRSFSCCHAGVLRIDVIAWMRRTADGIKSNLAGMVPSWSADQRKCSITRI
jgi:hypothetical protein